MRFFLAAILLTALFAASCEQGADTYHTTNEYIYPPIDTTGHGEDTTHHEDSLRAFLVQPADGDEFEMVYQWQHWDSPNIMGCYWDFSIDTLYRARIIVNRPGVTWIATPHAVYGSGYSFTPGYSLYPNSDTFSVVFGEIQRYHFSYMPPDSYHLQIWVTGFQNLGPDSAWSTDTIAVWLKPRADVSYQLPVAPTLDSVYEYEPGYGLHANWCLESPFVDYVLVSRTIDGETIPRIDSLRGASLSLYRSAYLPATRYTLQVFSGNALGRSPGSNTISIVTGDPLPPIYLSGYSPGSGRVILNWTNRYGGGDSVIVDRRLANGTWTMLTVYRPLNESVGNYYEDRTAVTDSLYFYRVGATFRGQVYWSDSLGVYVN